MSIVQLKTTKDDINVLRKECGAWLKSKREAAGLSQRDLALQVGFEFYTFISQIESGRGRVPPERYEAYAEAIRVSPREFAKTMMKYNEPTVYRLLFDDAEEQVEAANSDRADMDTIVARLAALEAKLLK